MLIGLVGLPNSGKSTLFKALTLADVEIANYPFTTIDANVGVAYVKRECACRRVGVKCNPKNSFCINGNRFIPVKLIDVAGLIEGAHAGKGLGNKFLDDIRKADILIHVLDISNTTDEEGKPGSGDAEKKIKILEREIELWLYEIVKRNFEKVRRIAETSGKDAIKLLAEQLSGLGIKEEHIKFASRHNIDSTDFIKELRKKSKPIIIAANKIDIDRAFENYKKLKKKYDMVPCSAEAELALREAAKKELIKYIPGENNFDIVDKGKLNERQIVALEYIRERVLKKIGSTGIQNLINKAVFDILNYIVVYPVANIHKMTDKQGNILPDAFLVKSGTTLKEFAEIVHSDMAKNFIGGIAYGTNQKLSANYKLKDGDIVQIVFGK